MKYLAALLLLFLFPAVPHATAQSECVLPPRLVVGEKGEVRFTDGEPLNIRTQPGRQSSVTDQLGEGARFTITAEPVCQDGLWWWPIERDRNPVTGWIAEGADDVYFVRPVSPALLAAVAELATLPVYDAEKLTTDTNPTAQPQPVFERPPEIDGRSLLNMRVSPDLTHVAWLYSNCTSNFGCAPETDYVLSITDDKGENRQTIWQGVPYDVGRLQIAGWRSDSGAVFMSINDTAPYPEPGSPAGAELGYPPQPDWFEVPLDGSAVAGEYVSYAAISADGEWRVTRDTGRTQESFLHIHNRDDSIRYTVPYPGYGLATEFSFSPGNAVLAWFTLGYTDYTLTSVSLYTLDLEDGTVSLLYDFPAGYPDIVGWQGDELLLVNWPDLQRDSNHMLHEQMRAALIFDVTTGERYRAP